MNQEEHQLQCACVRWFAYQHPELNGLLFAIPNGSYRNKATAGKLKAEGVVPGVSDLILLVPQHIETLATPRNGVWYHDTHGLCIEMKTEKGYQSPEQKEWAEKVRRQGFRYVVCRSLEEFIAAVEDYLSLPF